MKLKDKLKALTIGVVTTFMTSCGFKSNEAEVIERSNDQHAFNIGSNTDKGAKKADSYIRVLGPNNDDFTQANRKATWECLATGDSIDIQMREEWKQELNAAGIPIAKKGKNDTDSLLVSVEKTEDGTLQNPVYGLNPKAEVNKEEYIDGYHVERSGTEHLVYKFDSSTFGLESVEDVRTRVSERVSVVNDESVVKTLRKGDKVNGYVVEKDGESPTEEVEVEMDVAQKFNFNYKRNAEYKKPRKKFLFFEVIDSPLSK